MGISVSGILSRYLSNQKTIELRELRKIFERFKQILEGNNIVLELISQLEDKLSGEYIFDINYIKKITRRISSEIYRVIYNLNNFSENQFSDLYTRQSEINSELEEILNSFTKPLDNILTVTYDEINSNIPEMVGAKNANLSEIRNYLKLQTPDGFVLTTYAYHYFMNHNRLWPEIRRIFNTSAIGQKGYAKQHDQIIEDLFSKTELPDKIKIAIATNIHAHFKQHKKHYPLAVRSSAYGEDDEQLSFAGQFKSFMNCTPDDVYSSYIKVISSRFKYNAMIYNKEKVSDESKLPMAVGIQKLIPAETAGVIYTVNPAENISDYIIVTAGYGLGINIVSGKVDADYFKISRLDPNEIKEYRIGIKNTKVICDKSGAVKSIPVEDSLKAKACLSDVQLSELAETALFLDRYFKRPLDIEWCFDNKGVLYILQCRPLRIPRKAKITAKNLKDILAKKSVIIQKEGQIAQRGIAAGKVHFVNEDDDPGTFPAGSIAVTKYTSPRLSGIIRRARAIITETGSSTGHMATVAREFGVPLIVNAENATRLLSDGAVITVDAEENIIYEGIVKELLEYETEAEDVFRELKEYKILRQLLRKISPLKLIDPKSPRFIAKNCQTYHDILRFSHEKAMQELINLNMSSRRFRGIKTKKLQLPIPLDLIVLDLGGGLSEETPEDIIKSIEHIQSVPMQGILKGLILPGVWSTKPMQLGIGDLISSMTRYSINADIGEYGGQNLAVISKKYLNLSLRLGYHFNVIDTYVSENVNDNYIYFRFVGGVTENERRHLRAILLKEILEKLNFKVTVTGDLVIARLKKWEAGKILNVLESIGKLIGFSRQLDTQMQDRESVKKYLNVFFSGLDRMN